MKQTSRIMVYHAGIMPDQAESLAKLSRENAARACAVWQSKTPEHVMSRGNIHRASAI